MTKFQTKCEEFLKIFPMLQCHECKDVPGPTGKDKKSLFEHIFFDVVLFFSISVGFYCSDAGKGLL